MSRTFLRHAMAFTLLALTGCQTTTVSNPKDIEAELQKYTIAQPARNPLALFDDPPPFDYDDLGKPHPAFFKEREDPVARVDRYKMRDKRKTYSFFQSAERLFQSGDPVAAALLAEKGSRLAFYPDDRSNFHMMAAIYWGAMGEYANAQGNMRRVIHATLAHSNISCSKRNFYRLYRAQAYRALSTNDAGEAILRASMSDRARKEYYASRSGGCTRDDKPAWTTLELDYIRAEALFELGEAQAAKALASNIISRNTKSARIWYPMGYMQSLILMSQITLAEDRATDAESYALMALQYLHQQAYGAASPLYGKASQALALALVAQAKFGDAGQVLDDVETAMAASTPDAWANLFENSIERGIIQRETGSPKSAVATFRAAAKTLEDRLGADSQQAQEARLWLAMSLPDTPLQELTGLVLKLMATWTENNLDQQIQQAGQSIRLKWVVEDYMDRVFDEAPNTINLTIAFEIAETLRSGQVQQALVESALRRLAPDDNIRKLVRQQQDTARKLAVLRQKLVDAKADFRIGKETEAHLAGLVKDTEIFAETLRAEVRAAIPDYDAVMQTDGFTLEDLTRRLQPGELVIASHFGRKNSIVWTVTSDGAITGRRQPKSSSKWSEDINALLASLKPKNGKVHSLNRFDTRLAHRLYEDLIGPPNVTINEAKHLIFIGNNALGTLPMGLLLTQKPQEVAISDLPLQGFGKLPWLIRDHAVSAVPSASALALLRQGPRDTDEGLRRVFFGIGDPVFNTAPDDKTNIASARGGDELVLRSIDSTRARSSATLENLPRLPDTADEILAIADVVGAKRSEDLLLGHEATETAVRTRNNTSSLREYRVLSFATHGLMPGDLNGLESPALALGNPGTTATEDWDDGLLTVEEIMEFDLNADWVLLSACNTAAPQSQTNEAYSGLGQAFFYAGARAVLLSNWAVQSDSTMQLMVNLFQQQKADITRAEALRRASLELMDRAFIDKQGKAQFSYAHPLFWAPFTIVGDGGM